MPIYLYSQIVNTEEKPFHSFIEIRFCISSYLYIIIYFPNKKENLPVLSSSYRIFHFIILWKLTTLR